MKVYPKSRLLQLANAYPSIIAGVALLSGLVYAVCALIGIEAPQPILTIFLYTGTILLGLIACVLFLVLFVGITHGVSWLTKR